MLLLGAILACSTTKAVTPQAYTVTSLQGLLSDVDFGWVSATAINTSGHVTSNWDYYDDCDTLYSGMVDGQYTGIIGGGFPWYGDASSADAINVKGQTTGYSALTIETVFRESCGYEESAVGPTHAYRSETGGMRDLGTLGGNYSRG